MDPFLAENWYLLKQFDLPFLLFTYEDLAFPTTKHSQEPPSLAEVTSKTDNISLAVQLPALRASLDCKLVPQKNTIFSFDQEFPGHLTLFLAVFATVF
jgi:hypothetical protein